MMMLYRLDKVLEYLSALEKGATREAAAPLLGLTQERLTLLLRIGRHELKHFGIAGVDSDEVIEAGKGQCGRLLLYTMRSEARAEVQLTAQLWAAATNGSWKAAQILLERRFASRWARVDREGVKKPVATPDTPQKGLSDAIADRLRRSVLGIAQKPKKLRPSGGSDE